MQLVTLVGEPGVGKSRIISELLGYMDEPQRTRDVAPRTLPSPDVAIEGIRQLRWAAFPSVPEQGFALLGRGRCLHQLGQQGSEAVLREARKVFVRLGARPLIEETDVQLAQAIALSS